MTVRCEGPQTLALWRPSAQRRHVGLDPGLVNEDQPARIEARLPRSPAPTSAQDVGAPLLKGEQCFFEPQSLAPQEQPDRIMPDLDPARGQFVLELVQRHVRGLAEPGRDEGTMRFQHRLAMAAHLARRDRPGRTIALRPLHDRGNRHSEPGCNRSAALTLQHRCHNPPSKIIRKRSSHPCWPPIQQES